MADPISAGLGAISLIQGKSAQKSADRQARSAEKSAKSLEARATKLFDVLFSTAENADKAGVYDPEKRIAALEADTGRYESRDTGNLAGAMRVAGYRPGDSEIGTRLDSVKIKYRRFLDDMREKIRVGSVREKQAAYAGANVGNLQPGIQGANTRFGYATQEANSYDPSAFLQSWLPSLKGGGSGGFQLPSGRTLKKTGGSPFYNYATG